MRITRVRYALAGLVLSFVAAGSAAAAPTISSFTPASGTIGDHVVITGTGFTGATAVTFNNVTAVTYTVNSATQITATVPNTASTGTIKVTAGGTATSATNFTVKPGMALSFAAGSPSSSPIVYGAGFHATTAVDAYFDSINVALFITSTTGTLSTTYQIPLWAQPGQHWLSFVERGTYLGAQKAFTVQTNWADEGFGPAGRGANPYENTITSGNVNGLTSAWSDFAGGATNQSPFVVAGSAVFVGDAAGDIYAYSMKTGATLWTASPGADLELSNPAAAVGRVFFGDSSGNVRSYSQTCRSDGAVCAPQWTTNIGVAVTAGLTFYKGTLYVPSADGSVHTLNPTTGVAGTPISGFDTTHGAVTTPVSFDVDGAFYYGAGTTLEYRLASGYAGSSAPGGTVSPIAINSASAFFTTSDGQVHRGGIGSWNTATSGSGCAPAPVVALGAVFAGGCNTLTAYNVKTGGVIWSVGTSQIQGIAEANGVLYVCEAGNVQAYDVYNGVYLWTGSGCNSAPEVTNGNVFAAYARITAYDFPTAVGQIRPAPSISSLHPDYKLKPQLSGTAIVSSNAVVANDE